MTAIDNLIANLRAFKTTDVSAPQVSSSPLLCDVNLMIAALQQVNAPAGPTFTFGNYVPVLAFGGASVGITYNARSGNFVKIAGIGSAPTVNLVFVNTNVSISSKGTSVGTATITLPTSHDATNDVLPDNMAMVMQNVTDTTGGLWGQAAVDSGIVGANTTAFTFSGNNIAFAQLTDVQFNATSRIQFSGWYFSL